MPTMINLSERARGVLVHSLTGSNESGEVYRNYFAARPGHHNQPEIDQLCAAGLMRKGRPCGSDGAYYYHCTKAGATAVGMELP